MQMIAYVPLSFLVIIIIKGFLCYYNDTCVVYRHTQKTLQFGNELRKSASLRELPYSGKFWGEKLAKLLC